MGGGKQDARQVPSSVRVTLPIDRAQVVRTRLDVILPPPPSRITAEEWRARLERTNG
jgi:hypothetical protein